MSFPLWLQKTLESLGIASGPRTSVKTRLPLARRDALAATRELSRVLVDGPTAGEAGETPEAADISLALGNLFRAQGDIDRAVALREDLLSRSGLDPQIKARAFFELGCDYRRAGLLDRALYAYKEARGRGFPEQAVSEELAHLYADSGNFTDAADEFAALRNPLAEAYFLVRQAEESAASGHDDAAQRLLRRAITVYPGSPEAHLALAGISIMGGDAPKAKEHVATGLAQTHSSGRLILLEGLHSLINGPAAPDIPPATLQTLVHALTEALEQREPDLMQYYYGGLFLQQSGRLEEAEQWFTKALVIEPDFWATRLALLGLAADKEVLPPLLAQQINFFTKVGAHAKRFICQPCGMRRDTIFSVCPRCRAWHSVAFRLSLQ